MSYSASGSSSAGAVLTSQGWGYTGPVSHSIDGFNLISEIIHKFDLEISIKKFEKKDSTVLSGAISGFIIKFGDIEYEALYGFTQYDKERVMLKLAAMYPEKILTQEELKKHIYKDALKEEK